MRKVSKIEPTIPDIPTNKHVAAYARVSTENNLSKHSLSAQVSYFSALIQKYPGWEYAGVYADYGETGTLRTRSEFERLIGDCEAGKIDIILTKSISRFARNTVDLLETVRRLRELGIEVRFEEQNIRSLSGDGELMMTILASFAQEESRSTSENVKWAKRKAFQKGKIYPFQIYGYRWHGEKLVIHHKEAEVVRLIYANYLNGISCEQTANQLKEMGIKTYKGADKFTPQTIRRMLYNEKYIGNVQLQKTFVEDHLTHKYKFNKGELPSYMVEGTHEAIIDKATFDAVQAERARRRALGSHANPAIPTTVLTSIIKCGKCGESYRHCTRFYKNGTKMPYWRCTSMINKNAKRCHAKNISEDIIKNTAAEALGLAAFDEVIFAEKVKLVIVPADYALVFHLNDGSEITTNFDYPQQKTFLDSIGRISQ